MSFGLKNGRFTKSIPKKKAINLKNKKFMIRKVMVLLQKIVEKVVFRKVCLREMGKGLLSLGCWLRLSESVVEKVVIVC